MQGEDCFCQPNLSATMASSMFPKGYIEIRPWFRLTPQPDVKE